jgi:hypothetical protein
MNETEHLVRLALKNGEKIDFYRDDDHTVRICSGDHCVILPKASGELTISLFNLLEPLGEIITEKEDEDEPKPG